MERRYIQSAVQYRESSDSSGATGIGVLEGYAAKFNVDSLDLGQYVERLLPGTFTKSLASNDIVALLNHKSDKPLGRVSNKTLTLNEDEIGLHFTLSLPDVTYAHDLRTLSIRQDILGCSFGFDVRPEDMSWTYENGTDVCTLSNVDLIEISCVTFPAYPQAGFTSVRSLLESKKKESREKNLKEFYQFQLDILRSQSDSRP